MQLGVHATLGPADQSTTPPFLTAMLVAVRCAFRYVASIITVFSPQCLAARPAIICAKIYGAANYQFTDFLKIGLTMNLVAGVTACAGIIWMFA